MLGPIQAGEGSHAGDRCFRRVRSSVKEATLVATKGAHAGVSVILAVVLFVTLPQETAC